MSDSNLLAAMGAAWEEADGLGWEDANGLGDLADLMGDLSGADDLEVGRRVRRAAQRAGMSASQMFQQLQRAMAMMRGGGGPAFPATLPGNPRAAFQSSIAPGTPARGERFSYMPFPSGSFTNGAATTVVLRTTSQRQLRTVRIVADQNRTAAAATAAIQITINEIKIGQEVQPAATGALPFRAFDPLANGIPVNLDPIDVNVPVEVTVVATAAPGVGESIQFALAFFGYSIK